MTFNIPDLSLSLPDPGWTSINRGVLICDECCSVHRSLGRHISIVKHLRHSGWPPALLQVRLEKLEEVGEKSTQVLAKSNQNGCFQCQSKFYMNETWYCHGKKNHNSLNKIYWVALFKILPPIISHIKKNDRIPLATLKFRTSLPLPSLPYTNGMLYSDTFKKKMCHSPEKRVTHLRT